MVDSLKIKELQQIPPHTEYIKSNNQHLHLLSTLDLLLNALMSSNQVSNCYLEYVQGNHFDIPIPHISKFVLLILIELYTPILDRMSSGIFGISWLSVLYLKWSLYFSKLTLPKWSHLMVVSNFKLKQQGLMYHFISSIKVNWRTIQGPVLSRTKIFNLDWMSFFPLFSLIFPFSPTFYYFFFTCSHSWSFTNSKHLRKLI